jgi:hypothetical protein
LQAKSPSVARDEARNSTLSVRSRHSATAARDFEMARVVLSAVEESKSPAMLITNVRHMRRGRGTGKGGSFCLDSADAHRESGQPKRQYVALPTLVLRQPG